MSDLEVELTAIEMTTPLPASAVSPDACNFYSAQHAPGSADEWPPLPGNIWNLPAWPLGDDFYLVDVRNFNYNPPKAKKLTAGGGMQSMAMGVPSPDDGSDTNGGSGEALASYTPLNLAASTNLWLAITNLANGTAGLMLSNTLADVQYEILAAPTLSGLMQTGGVSVATVFGSELTNWTPASIIATNQPTLFLRVRSDADDGSGLPIWWQLQYFGYVGVDPNGDPAGDGWSNIQKYEYDMNPNQYYPPPAPQNTNAPPPTFGIIPGPQGYLYVIGSGLPADLKSIRVFRYPNQNVWPIQNTGIIDLPTGYFDIPVAAITNGIAQIPPSQAYSFSDDQYALSAVESNGIMSAPSGYINYYNFVFVDGRAQLKDNLRFLLRAAGGDGPFEVNNTTQPTNYVYSGFYDSSAYFDPLSPFENNYFYRNFDFDINNLVSSNYFSSYNSPDPYYSVLVGIPSGVYFDINYNPDFYRDVYTGNLTYGLNYASFISTNSIVAPSSWNASQANWLFPPSSSDYDTDVFPDGGNWFGLSYLSALSPYYTNGTFLTETFYPNITPTNVPGGFYFDTVQPGLQTVGYYFAHVGLDPMPEQGNFSTTNTTPLLIVGVGQQFSYSIAGYAKLALTNGNPGVYAYLGQYFDKAYQINTNGVVTTNTTGVLSPYGQFFATQPGPTALVTMPDIDSPYQRGTCTVYAVSINLDANHDGNMDSSFNGTDFTSANSPYVFWCNNNFDRGHQVDGNDNEQDDVLQGQAGLDPKDFDGNYKVSGNRQIPCVRDLEDFSRLWINGVTSNLLAALPSGSTITLNWGDVGSPYSGNPTIDLFTAADPDGGIGYLTNSTIAAQQINIFQCPYIQRLAPGGSIQLNTIQFANNWAGNHFIWCGVTNGSGQLNLTIQDGNGNVLAQASQWIQIVDIKQMYERWTVGDAPNAVSNQVPLTVAVRATDGLPTAAFQYPPPPNANTPYILFVHGWNLETWEKDRYAETAFKRLYWQGYQGRFGEFRWPTFADFPFSEFSAQAFDLRNFDNSESNAWASATGLLNKLNDLNTEYPGQVYLMAHSLGNVVAGEALRLAGNNQVVNTYIAMQGAISAHTYDPNTAARSFSPGTPDNYANYWTNNAPCYFSGSAGAGTYVNFFNTNDYALHSATFSWEYDQNHKPDVSIAYPGYHYSVSSLHPNGYYVQYGSTSNAFYNLNFPTNTYSIFAYCDQSRSYALGAEAGISTFNRKIDLQSIWPPDLHPQGSYKEHVWHMGECK